jgi:hypothetical protein
VTAGARSVKPPSTAGGRGGRPVRLLGRLTLLVPTLGILTLACATSPRPAAETPPPRVKDSAPDKLAAQRAASGNLHLDEEDNRWGIDATRESKTAREGQTPSAPSPPAAGSAAPPPAP